MGKVYHITLPEPPSVNRIYRTGNKRVYKTDDANAYTELVQWLCTSQGITQPFTGDVFVDMKWYRSRKNGDVDNRTKLLYDSLEGFAYANDKQITDDFRHKRYDKKNPRVELIIEELNDGDTDYMEWKAIRQYIEMCKSTRNNKTGNVTTT